MPEQSLNILIVDDEERSRELMQRLVGLIDLPLNVVGSVGSIKEAVSVLDEFSPDVVLLDINLSNESGFDLVKFIDPGKTHIVFATAHDEYAIDAFKVSAVDYLLKPIELDELEKALLKIRAMSAANSQAVSELTENLNLDGFKSDRIALPMLNGYEFVPYDDILYCEANGSYCDISVSKDRKLTISKPLSYVQDKLTGAEFLRIHNSYLVNCGKIVKYIRGDGGSVVMDDNSELPVSRANKADLMRILGLD